LLLGQEQLFILYFQLNLVDLKFMDELLLIDLGKIRLSFLRFGN
jgi:hypothetical protein